MDPGVRICRTVDEYGAQGQNRLRLCMEFASGISRRQLGDPGVRICRTVDESEAQGQNRMCLCSQLVVPREQTLAILFSRSEQLPLIHRTPHLASQPASKPHGGRDKSKHNARGSRSSGGPGVRICRTVDDSGVHGQNRLCLCMEFASGISRRQLARTPPGRHLVTQVLESVELSTNMELNVRI